MYFAKPLCVYSDKMFVEYVLKLYMKVQKIIGINKLN